MASFSRIPLLHRSYLEYIGESYSLSLAWGELEWVSGITSIRIIHTAVDVYVCRAHQERIGLGKGIKYDSICCSHFT
jgi:hypothetical protein